MKTTESTTQLTEIENLKQTYEKLRLIITEKGFIQEWYKLIPKSKNATQAFHDLNELYYENTEPKTYRFNNYNVFLNRIKSSYNN
ncbi:MAG: hypothetical protein COC22_00640 [Flavobacteriaceae bacterium]|nr:MAG: hypothetical protein COC22_00640 [Flavobacteriaceae bacterium]